MPARPSGSATEHTIVCARSLGGVPPARDFGWISRGPVSPPSIGTHSPTSHRRTHGQKILSWPRCRCTACGSISRSTSAPTGRLSLAARQFKEGSVQRACNTGCSCSAASRWTTPAPGLRHRPTGATRRSRCGTPRRAMLDMGVAAERLGFDMFWLTEHHFQHEGYEVIPNGLLFGAVAGRADVADQDRRDVPHRPAVASAALRRGLRHAAQPLRAARAMLGVGRGTVPREAAVARHAGRLVRQPRPGRGRPDQPRDDGRGDGRDPRRARERVVQLPRRALRPPAARHPRPRRLGRAAHARPAARCTRTRSGRRSPRRRRSSTCPARASAACSGCSTTSSSGSGGSATPRSTSSTTARARRPARSASWCSTSASRTRHEQAWRTGSHRATTSSGSSSGRTAGRRATWARTASRRRRG